MMMFRRDKSLPHNPIRGGVNPSLGTQFRLWAIFDFANSLLYTNVVLYFPQWITIERGMPDLFYNLTLTLSTFLLLITTPALGAISDRLGKKVWFLRATAFSMIVSTLLIAVASSSRIPNHYLWMIASLLFLIVNYCYQLSLVFYDSMLGAMVPAERYARASSFGLAAGWLGAIIGILLVLPAVQGTITLFQPGGRIQVFVLAPVLFAVVSAYPLMHLKEPTPRTSPIPHLRVRNVYLQVWRDLRALPKSRNVFWFLVAYWLFSDGILTMQENLPIYLERVFGIPDEEKAIIAVGVLLMVIIGATVTGLVGDRFSTSRALITSLALGCVGMIALSLFQDRNIFLLTLMAVSAALGSTWALARALYTKLAPPTRRGEYFGFYSISERSASIIGPLVWGSVVTSMSGTGSVAYRLPLLLMAVLLGLSLAPLAQLRMTNRSVSSQTRG